MPRVTVIIPTNRPTAVVGPCLRALAEQDFDPRETEVLVVHNGPGAPPSWPNDAWPFQISVLHIDEASASAARNAGLDRARGEIILVLNDDVLPGPNLVAAHATAHERLKQPGLVLGHCDWPTYDDETVFDRMVHTTSMLFFYDQMRAHQWYGFRHAWTLNLSWNRAITEAVRFDERIRFYYEDLEWAHRVEQRFGARVWYEPEANAVHDHRHTLAGYLDHEFNMGLTAPTLWECNPGCFREIYGTDLDDAFVEYCRRFVETEGRREEEIRRSLDDALMLRPAELSSSPEALANIIRVLYVAHLPLKRLAFRRGLAQAAEHRSPSESAPSLAR